jgi:hypothetical protein
MVMVCDQRALGEPKPVKPKDIASRQNLNPGTDRLGFIPYLKIRSLVMSWVLAARTTT